MPSGGSDDHRPQMWFIDVAVHPGETQGGVVAKIVAGVGKAIGAAAGTLTERRSKPLVAIPTLGVGGGGLDAVRGQADRGIARGLRESSW